MSAPLQPAPPVRRADEHEPQQQSPSAWTPLRARFALDADTPHRPITPKWDDDVEQQQPQTARRASDGPRGLPPLRSKSEPPTPRDRASKTGAAAKITPDAKGGAAVYAAARRVRESAEALRWLHGHATLADQSPTWWHPQNRVATAASRWDDKHIELGGRAFFSLEELGDDPTSERRQRDFHRRLWEVKGAACSYFHACFSSPLISSAAAEQSVATSGAPPP